MVLFSARRKASSEVQPGSRYGVGLARTGTDWHGLGGRLGPAEPSGCHGHAWASYCTVDIICFVLVVAEQPTR